MIHSFFKPTAPVKEEPGASASTPDKSKTEAKTDAKDVVKVKKESATIKLCTYNSELHMCISSDQMEGELTYIVGLTVYTGGPAHHYLKEYSIE